MLGAISLDSVRRSARGRDRLASRVRQRRARGGPARVRHSASLTGGRGPPGGRISGVSADPLPRRREDAPCSRPVRADDRRIRLLAIGLRFRCSRWRRWGAPTWCRCSPARAWFRSPRPDRMRGRVSAVSTLFIGASNELGEFESGVVARLLGPVRAVAFGGLGAMAVTALWAWLFPSLRKADRLA